MSYDSRAIQADLSAWMAEATKRVQVEAQFIEHQVARPLWSRYTTFAQLNPITTVLFTTFAILAALPIFTFFAFATFVVSSFALAATASVLFFSFWIIGGALGFLFFALSFVGFTSMMVALGVFGTVLSYRFVMHVTNSESGGVWPAVKAWSTESTARFGVPVRPAPQPSLSTVPKGKFVD